LLGFITFQIGDVMLSKRWGSYTYIFLGGVVFKISPAALASIKGWAAYDTLSEIDLPTGFF